MAFENAEAAYAWLDSQIDYERILSSVQYTTSDFAVDEFRERLGALGDPHLARPAIHIAGTRGKGSAALALEALLRASGQRIATYTSPHLREFRERIRVAGAPIGGADFARLLGPIAGLHEAALGESRTEAGAVRGALFKTVFEHLTALYFATAREAAVDWMVVETGLGGRLDATNVLPPGPVLWTRIGLEHTRLLGTTHAAIAAEKAAILKPGGWAVMGAQSQPACAASGSDGASPDDARAVFVARARECGAELEFAEQLCPIRRTQAHPDGLRLSIGFEGEDLDLDTRLFGDFQAENLQNALAMLAALRRRGFVPRAARSDLAGALRALLLPGRMERVRRAPDLFADGGHCPTAARAIARAMAGHFGSEPAGLIVGMMEDKDHEGFFAGLAAWPGWRWVRCHRLASPRAAAPERLARAAAAALHCPVFITSNLTDALESADLDADKDIRVVAMGSLHGVAGAEDWGAGHGRAAAGRKSQSTA